MVVGWLAVVDRVPSHERFVRRTAAVQSVYGQGPHRGRGLGGHLIEWMIASARDGTRLPADSPVLGVALSTGDGAVVEVSKAASVTVLK